MSITIQTLDVTLNTTTRKLTVPQGNIYVGDSNSTNIVLTISTDYASAKWYFEYQLNKNDAVISPLLTVVTTTIDTDTIHTITVPIDSNMTAENGRLNISFRAYQSTGELLIHTSSEPLQIKYTLNADTTAGTNNPNFIENAQAILDEVVTGLPLKVDKIDGYSLIADTSITRLANTSGTNTGDQDLSGKADLVGGVVPSTQLPAYVDDVLEYANFAAFPTTGETGKIYVTLDTNLTYRWSGTVYTEISKSIALGESSSTAYRGDRGKIAYDYSQLTDKVARDANDNVSINNTLDGFQIITSSSTHINLTVTSPFQTFIIGTYSQYVYLPLTSTLSLGQQYFVGNKTNKNIVIYPNTGGTITILRPNEQATFTCISLSANDITAWDTKATRATTDGITEGIYNLFYTDDRVNALVGLDISSREPSINKVNDFTIKDSAHFPTTYAVDTYISRFLAGLSTAFEPQVTGKHLSANDFTDLLKVKLDAIASGATAYTDQLAVNANANYIARRGGLVAIHTTNGTETSFTISGLDLLGDGEYIITFVGVNSAGKNINMFINGDTTTTDYQTAINGGNMADGALAFLVGSDNAYSTISMSMSVANTKPIAICPYAQVLTGGATVYSTRVWEKKATATNVTSITFATSDGSAFTSNQVCRVYKRGVL